MVRKWKLQGISALLFILLVGVSLTIDSNQALGQTGALPETTSEQAEDTETDEENGATGEQPSEESDEAEPGSEQTEEPAKEELSEESSEPADSAAESEEASETEESSEEVSLEEAETEETLEENKESQSPQQHERMEPLQNPGLLDVRLLTGTTLNSVHETVGETERITLNYHGDSLLNLQLLSNEYAVFHLPTEIINVISNKICPVLIMHLACLALLGIEGILIQMKLL